MGAGISGLGQPLVNLEPPSGGATYDEEVGDLLPAAFAALGAVVGLFVGAAVGSIVIGGLLGVGPVATWPLVVGGLTGATACAWAGLRLSRRVGYRVQRR